MSKMSQLHAYLTEQAAELGYESIEEAEANGYVVDYENKTLKRDAMASLSLAHEAWEAERQHLITKLTVLQDKWGKFGADKDSLNTLELTINFLRGCKDGC